jgi:hypothetical protein
MALAACAVLLLGIEPVYLPVLFGILALAFTIALETFAPRDGGLLSRSAMRQRRETVEHPFGTIKARMGATHFLTKTLPQVATEMALSVLAYNLTRVINIVGTKPLMAAIAA